MTAGIVRYFSQKTDTPKPQPNVITGYVEPSDVRQVKQLLQQLGVNSVGFPDVWDVVDTPQTGEYKMVPKGGTTIPELIRTGDSLATIACGVFASEQAAQVLEAKCKVPAHFLELSIGINATDRFIQKVIELTGVTPPDALDDERGRLVDIMTDMQQYLYRKRVALYGDYASDSPI